MTVNPLMPLEHLIALLAVLFAAGLILSWRGSSRLPVHLRCAACLARGVALAALSAIALNVGVWRKPDAETKPRWCVLMDRSASMATADSDGQSRWASACRLIAGLERDAADRRVFDCQTFSDGLDGARSPQNKLSEQRPDGPTTAISRSVTAATAAGATAGGAPVGILLLTDGRETDPEADPLQAGMQARAQDAPVLAVMLGQHKERHDLSVRAARRRVIGFVGQPARIQGVAVSRWTSEVNLPVYLTDVDGAAVATNTVRLPASGESPFSFAVTPQRPGSVSYTLKIGAWNGDGDARNNEAPVELQVLNKKIRVLLAEGVPYWDSKFLAQHLRKQPNMEVTALYRTAPDRFFCQSPDGTTRAEAEGIFPSDAKALGAYDLIVFGKGVEYFMTPERVAALKSFVADQGGSVIFARGKPYAEAGGGVEDLEPVTWAGASAVECRFAPCREGEDAGLFSGLLPGREDAVWSRVPTVRCSQTAIGLKSFAQVLAEGRRAGQGTEVSAQPAFPLLVSRRFGKGLSVVMNIDEFWQWSFFSAAKEASAMYGDLWAQVLLWSGTYAEFLPGHAYALHLGQSVAQPNRPVRIQVRHRGPVAHDAANPKIRVTRGNELIQELALAAEADGDRWEGALSLAEPGLYRVALAAPQEQAAGGDVGALLQILAPLGEGDDVNPDAEYLARLTASSGGRVVSAEHVAEALERREADRGRVTARDAQATWVPMWDRSWLLVLTLMALTAEWTIRRRNGLA